MHLLQVCNVGNICGGTAACAWTVTRSLPQVRHTAVFLSPPTSETRAAFAPARVLHAERIDDALRTAHQPDLILFHNTSPSRVSLTRSVPTMQYVHSAGTRAAADLTVACSEWLAARQAAAGRMRVEVLYQAVPRPLPPALPVPRQLRDRLVIGRICTPSHQKWPGDLIPFYAKLAQQFPAVEWEFVGCPSSLQVKLKQACDGRAAFFPASWPARSRLWHWDALLYHHPTLTESFGRTVAESLRVGCIPIVDGRGGFVEQITPECGYLCATEDAFSSAVDAIQDASRRRTLSRAAREQGEHRFSLEHFGRELLGWFGRLAQYTARG